jgi:DEAD/DEAH box helicase domain-containing protein
MLLESRNESVVANPENEKILSRHLVCAAHERPLSPTELTRFGTGALGLAEALDRSGELQFRAGLFFYPGVDSPALGVSIRGSGTDSVTLYLEGRELGSMEFGRALGSAHEGAVYLHRAQSFIVTSLDLMQRRADLEAFDGDYYTQSILQSVVAPQIAINQIEASGIGISLSGITVTDTVEGFRRKSLDGDRVLSVEVLDLPATTFDTIGVRFDLPELDPDEDMATQIGGVHGFEHAMLAVAPFLAGCDRGDLGSAWYSVFPDTMRPAVFIFDRAPGGVGLGEKLFEVRSAWVRAARQLLASCECEGGCPACLYSPRCESGNEALSKVGALGLLRRLVG